jgi:hypothetical protein
MIQLDGTNEKIQATPGTTGTIDCHASWVDLSGTTVTPDSLESSITTAATAVDVVTSPAASTQRRIKYLGFRNRHATVSSTLLIAKLVAAAVTELFKCVLLPGWGCIYNGATWFVYDDKGAVVTGPTAGRYLRSTVLSAGTSFTTGVDTETIFVRMVGGGGGGGGCTSVAAAAVAAGGGGAGAYAEKTFDVTPNTAYAYAIGAGGAGVSAAAGGNGGSTSMTVGGVTVTAPGGTGAPQAVATTTLTAKAGGAGGAIATSGDVNEGGAPGEYGVTLIVATPIVASGNGGSSNMGAGGLGIVAVGNGNNAVGPGGGGGGSATGVSAARTGGNGAAGQIIVDEYT